MSATQTKSSRRVLAKRLINKIRQKDIKLPSFITRILFLRHSVRQIPSLVTLANGSVVQLQSFSKEQLPLYSYPPNTQDNGNLSGTGWQLSTKLGKYIFDNFLLDSNKIKSTYVRSSSETDRTVNTGIAITRSINNEISKNQKINESKSITDNSMTETNKIRNKNDKLISISFSVEKDFNGKLSDPLFFPQLFYGYKLPDSALTEKEARFKIIEPKINKVAEAIAETFGVKLPEETKITLNNITGRLAIENVFSQEPNFSLYSGIDLGITEKNRKRICEGIVLRQFVDNIPIAAQQNSSNMAQYLVNTLSQKNGRVTILISNDNPITSLAALLGYKFKTPGWPTQFVNANAGFLFTLYSYRDHSVDKRVSDKSHKSDKSNNKSDKNNNNKNKSDKRNDKSDKNSKKNNKCSKHNTEKNINDRNDLINGRDDFINGRDDLITVQFLGPDVNEDPNFILSPVLDQNCNEITNIPFNEFISLVESRINPAYVNLSEVNNVKAYRVS